MKLEIFDDVPKPLVNKYYQSKAIGAVETKAVKTSRSSYYSSKSAATASNYYSPPKTSLSKSKEAKDPVKLRIKNDLYEKVNVFWHDYTGKLVFYKQVGPNDEWSIASFKTHVWSV